MRERSRIKIKLLEKFIPINIKTIIRHTNKGKNVNEKIIL